MNSLSFILLFTLAAGPVPDKVGPTVIDSIQLAQPGEVHIYDFPGTRFEASRQGRLKHIPMDYILGGFQKRPGSHVWIGEHIGKWLHAAVLTWQTTGDEELKKMMDVAVKDLLATQLPDGYLGTYEEKDRWTSWDVWVHKYDLIGLLTYYRATGNEEALKAAVKIGDLLVATFGPDKKDIIAAGTHVGMAATSALEPMVRLYRVTGDKRYLQFCNYLVDSWDQPHGPKVLKSLLDHGKVNRTANGKAYEMMSNLVGLCELYRVQPKGEYLRACEIAWDDIRKNQMYVTGGVSMREHFQPDGHFPDIGEVAETCANVTWLQLSMHLLGITGKAKYAEVAEWVIYNHLLGAQTGDGEEWCYYMPLVGRKPFSKEVKCCQSSGPRGVALMPSVYYGMSPGKVRVNMYGESKYRGEMDGTGIVIEQKTNYPGDGRIEIIIKPEKPLVFGLELRIPEWTSHIQVSVNGEVMESAPYEGIVGLDREWKPGDRVLLKMDIPTRWIRGKGEHEGMLAAANGPFVLCLNVRRNLHLNAMELVAVDESTPFTPAGEIRGARGKERDYSAAVKVKFLTATGFQPADLLLTPFAMGWNEPIRVWLRTESEIKNLGLKTESD